MKKIGILTWYYGINYGAKLHSYAMQKILISKGYECEFINFCPLKNRYRNYRSEISLKHPSKIIVSINRCIRMQAFMIRYKIGNKVRDAKDINSCNYDAVLLGSDEILRIVHPQANKIYYGVGINGFKFIYAASAGQTDCSTILDDDIKQSLMEMQSISVRGINTKRLIENNVQKPVEIVLDPTLLYDFKEFNDVFLYENYILLYAFYDVDSIKASLIDYARLNGYKIISILKEYDWADKSILNINVEEWLSAFKKAKLVVTDSFHAVCFSIKNKKEVIPIGSADKINKIRDLLRLLGIDRDFYKGEEIEDILQTPIDYKRAYELLASYREKSLKRLDETLSNL